VLNFIYYPVSFILWVWHKAFSALFGDTGWGGGIAWSLAVVFLVFTLRAFLYKPFVSQVRSMRKMQEFQPEIAKLRKKYANDKQKQAAEMQRLQKEHGVNPVAGCLPILVQLPVFIGLFHVLRSFNPVLTDGAPRTENYFFDQAGVESFNNASLFGAKLGAWVTQGSEALIAQGTTMANMIIVMTPADDRGGHLHAHHGPPFGGPPGRVRPGHGQPADRDHAEADALRVPDRCGRRSAVPAAGDPHLLGVEQPVDARPAVRRLPQDRRGAGGEEGAGRRQPAGARPAARPEAGAPGGQARARGRDPRTRGRRAAREEARCEAGRAEAAARLGQEGSTNGVAKTNGTGKNGSGGTAGAGSSGAGAAPGARRPRKRR
jgi:YidC/Oxa1 family membrane protein insertase